MGDSISPIINSSHEIKIRAGEETRGERSWRSVILSTKTGPDESEQENRKLVTYARDYFVI